MTGNVIAVATVHVPSNSDGSTWYYAAAHTLLLGARRCTEQRGCPIPSYEQFAQVTAHNRGRTEVESWLIVG
jgi:hypothetical protein